MSNLKSERSICSPNVNSLMKISLGLILFTIVSTALVYAENETENNLMINISENAFLYASAQYFDNSMISTNPGESIIIINDDTVSHSFVSGASNNNNIGKINYDEFLICEFDPNYTSIYSNQNDVTDCDFTKDNRIITGEISPGESISIPIDEVGTFRIIDPDYPWMEIAVYSFPESSTQADRIEGKTISTPSVTASIENISVLIDDISFNVPYSISGMSITGIEADTESMSLIFSVDVTDSTGKLNVEFDRTFFDSIYDGEDDIFFVLTDGDETISKEIETTSQSRSLTIDVPSGTEELEIIGSTFNNNEFELVVETPIVETPIVETPIVETPIVENSNQCGPGTVLENNICILDKRCGPGTVLENQICILDSTPTKSSSIGNTKELIMSVTVAFVIAGIIGIVFALISKANRNKN